MANAIELWRRVRCQEPAKMSEGTLLPRVLAFAKHHASGSRTRFFSLILIYFLEPQVGVTKITNRRINKDSDKIN